MFNINICPITHCTPLITDHNIHATFTLQITYEHMIHTDSICFALSTAIYGRRVVERFKLENIPPRYISLITNRLHGFV
jgi:hypothetical protein